MKNKILQEFLDSEIIIKSQEKLIQYIDFCIENNQLKRIKGKTSHHHILPQADSLPFTGFSNLKENPWNGTHLSYYNHYYAHWLFTESIDDYGQLHAFTAMHNSDIKNGRINEEDLIAEEEFQIKMEERSKKHREWYKNNTNKVTNTMEKVKKTMSKKYINNEGKITTKYAERGLLCSKTKNSKEWKETIGKEALLKTQKIKSSKEWKETVGKEQGLRQSEIMKVEGNKRGKVQSKTKNSKEWKETKGKNKVSKFIKTTNSKLWLETTGKNKANKISKTRLSKEWKERVGQEAKRKLAETNLRKGKWFRLHNTKTIEYELIPRIDLVKISNALLKSSKNSRLGKTTKSKLTLNSAGKLNLIGWYAEEIYPSYESITDYINNFK